MPSHNVTFSWSGFEEPQGFPLTYEVLFPAVNGSNWTDVGFARQVSLSAVGGVGSGLEEGVAHRAEVRAVNLAGMRSSASVGVEFVIDSTYPNVTG